MNALGTPTKPANLENARAAANEAERARQMPPKPNLPQHQTTHPKISFDSPEVAAMSSSGEVGLEHIRDMPVLATPERQDPYTQIQANKDQIQDALNTMFKDKGDINQLEQEEINDTIVEQLIDPSDSAKSTYDDFNQLLGIYASISDPKSDEWPAKDQKKKVQFAISLLLATGGIVSTVVAGPSIGTFFVAASVLRAAQMYPEVIKEIGYNKMVGHERGLLKNITMRADEEIKSFVEGLKLAEGQQPSEAQLLELYKRVNGYAGEVDRIMKNVRKREKEATESNTDSQDGTENV